MSKKSKASEREGNTKPLSKSYTQSVKWCFTLNNYTNEQYEQVLAECQIHNLKYCVGKEIGEKGTPHLQGCILSKKKFRPSEIKGLWAMGCHWEKCKGSWDSNLWYCSKEGEFMANVDIPPRDDINKVWSWEKIKLYDWELKIIDIIKQPPDNRSIYWFYDTKCGAGKTTFTKYLVTKHKAIISGGKSADMKNNIVDYYNKKKKTPELIIVNLTKTLDLDYVSYTGIEETKDMLFYSGKYEGGMICGECPHLIIFSNELPSLTGVDPTRWKIYDMVNKDWKVMNNNNNNKIMLDD